MIAGGSLSSTGFNIDIYIESDSWVEYRIQYESSDGINYTRTTFESDGEPLENPVDMTTVIKAGSHWDESYEFNSLLGYFMIVGSTTYEGLFNYVSTNNQFEYAPTQLNTISEDVYGKSFYNGTGRFNGTLQNITNLNIDQVKTRVNLYQSLSYLELNENITNVYQLFSFSSLYNIPNFDTSNVTNMAAMFQGCLNITNVHNYNTSKVTNMYYLFESCYNLTTIPNFDTSNVINMAGMFGSCSNLTTIPNYNTINVTNMSTMFIACYNLTTIPNFDTSNVTSMSDIFHNCTNLTSIPNFNTINVTNAMNMFRFCSNLTDIPQLNLNSITNHNGLSDTFVGCTNLSSAAYANIANILPNLAAYNDSYTLQFIGLTAQNFTSEQQWILYNKGYYDALWDTANWSTQYNVYYET